METTFIYGNVLVIHSESTENVGIFHKRKFSHKRRSYQITLAVKQPIFSKKQYFTLFSRLNCSFSLFSKQHKWIWNNLQHYSNLGQTVLHRLCGLWQVSRVIWTVFLSEKWLQLLGEKNKAFKREDTDAEFRLRQNFSMGEADFNQFIPQRNQLVVAADNFCREQNL